ncbi:MAG: GatB/YqeY domain-containing protein [Bacteroidales bacterium]|nr:GatB/YqeY domain-containing protein [Bacteroidales bacterium]MBN2757724.1 GatB/YqeY domain-containing protein [Bacteroidales bacterium]
MSITEQINNDIKIAMKEKNAVKLAALRAVKSAFLIEQTSGNKDSEITEEKGLKIIQKLIKQRKDSAEIYKEQNRNDLLEKEIGEITFLEIYLPKQLSEEELIDIIADAIKTTGALSIKDMGKVIGIVNNKVAGRAEGKIIAQKVKELLG